MLCCTSKSLNEIEQAKRNKQIKNKLKDIRNEMYKRFNILLLGTGDAGKSTFVRQLRFVYENNLPTQERVKLTNILRDNCMESIKKLIFACEEYDISFPNKLKKIADRVVNIEDLTPGVVEDVLVLWNSQCISQVLKFHTSLQLPGGLTGVKYFLENARRFASADFSPTQEDLVRVKMRTTGITEVIFMVGNQEFRIIDVGGQRSERRKWLHCFDSVNIIFYMVALNEYNMVLEEDGITNRLQESVKLFQFLSGTEWLRQIPCIIILNKSDLFKQAIESKPLEKHFPDYLEFQRCLKDSKEQNEFDVGIEYIKDMFMKNYRGSTTLYSFVTCALDKDQCDTVFKVVRREILEKGIQCTGIF